MAACFGLHLQLHHSHIHGLLPFLPPLWFRASQPCSLADFTHGNSRKVDRPLYNHSAQEFVQELEVHHALAQDSLAKASTHQARAHDSHYHVEEFGVGDEVLINPHSLDLVDVKGTGWKLLQ